MKHLATPRFWECYRRLPLEVRQVADRAYELLKSDGRHPSLQFKKIGSYWSVRVGLHHRALGTESAGDLIWFWIGAHSEYDALIKRS